MKRVLLFFIRLYRRGISPYTKPSCRYIPTCSEYARTAVERFGPARGSVMAAKRLEKMTSGLEPRRSAVDRVTMPAQT